MIEPSRAKQTLSASISKGEEIERVVWIQTGFLGDIVLSTAAFSLMRHRFPKVQQVAITTPVGKPVLEQCPAIDEVITYDKRRSGIMAFRSVKTSLSGLGKKRTVILKPHLSYRSSLLARYIAEPTITFREARLKSLADQCIDRVAVLHESERVSLLLEPFGITREEILGQRPNLSAIPLSPASSDWEQRLSQHKGALVGIAAGSVWGTKRWTKSGYADLAKRLLEENNHLGIVLIGSPDEEAIALEIESQVQKHLKRFPTDHAFILNLAGRTKVADLLKVIPRLDLLVANDSACVHFASAFEIPSVVIFGPTVPEMGFAPLGERSSVVEVKNLPCRPCSHHGPMTCPLGHFKCMKDNSVDSVYVECLKQLKSSHLR